jgi:hypothetical protein
MNVRVIERRRWPGISRLPALYPALPEQADHEITCRWIAFGHNCCSQPCLRGQVLFIIRGAVVMMQNVEKSVRRDSVFLVSDISCSGKARIVQM